LIDAVRTVLYPITHAKAVWFNKAASKSVYDAVTDVMGSSNVFSASTSYAVGDYTIYQSALYRCITAHSAGAWNASHFAKVDLKTLNGEAVKSISRSGTTFTATRTDGTTFTFTQQDNNTTTGDGIKTKVAKTGSGSTVTNTVAAGTTLDNTVATLLNNDYALNSAKQPKTMSTTIAGQTTVEGCLSQLNTHLSEKHIYQDVTLYPSGINVNTQNIFGLPIGVTSDYRVTSCLLIGVSGTGASWDITINHLAATIDIANNRLDIEWMGSKIQNYHYLITYTKMN
jgi:hypothetical protein